MKKVMFAALLVGAMSMTQVVNAQENRGVCQADTCQAGERTECVERDSTFRRERHTQRMIQELGLSEEQVSQMNAINGEFVAAQKQMREAREKREAAMKEILTPEQYEKYMQMRNHRHGQRGGQPQMRHHRGHRHVSTPVVDGRQMRGRECCGRCSEASPAAPQETPAQ